MSVKSKLLNASQAAEFMDMWRSDFYNEFLRTGKIKPTDQIGMLKVYALSDLKKLKKKYDTNA